MQLRNNVHLVPMVTTLQCDSTGSGLNSVGMVADKRPLSHGVGPLHHAVVN